MEGEMIQNVPGACRKHKRQGRPEADCEDCQKAQRKQMMERSSRGIKS